MSNHRTERCACTAIIHPGMGALQTVVGQTPIYVCRDCALAALRQTRLTSTIQYFILRADGMRFRQKALGQYLWTSDSEKTSYFTDVNEARALVREMATRGIDADLEESHP